MSIQALFNLKGKVALVTGGSRGLGRAMALALAQAGADVALNARSANGLQAAVQEIQRLGVRALAVPGDVSQQEDAKRMVERTHQQFGRIDILVNNAGVWEGTYFVRLPKEAWDRVLSVNLTGAYLVARWVARGMLKQRSGKIIQIASISGLKGSPQAAAYCAAKAGLIQMTRVMAIELGPAGIRVNAIAPGFFATDMTRPYTETEEPAEKSAFENYVGKIPLGRFGRPEDLAGLVVFLASPASDHITGQTIVIDGGESLV